MSTLKISLLLACFFATGCADKTEDTASSGAVSEVEAASTCEDIPCAEGFACVDVDGDLACENVDECTEGTADCAEGYSCSDTEGSFTCDNVDECTDGTAECDEGYACTDTDGSFTCDNVNECTDGTAECDEGYSCSDTEGSYTCDNVDECAEETAECDEGFACADTDGSYTCDNVDECADGTGECMDGYACTDTDGSYTCDNVDECAEGTFECMAGYGCSDTDGSYTCDNIDECAEGTYECDSGLACMDTEGSYTCVNVDECTDGSAEGVCPAGYGCSDTEDSFTCVNIDECADGTDDCEAGFTCFDTVGSYTCDNNDECADGTDDCGEGYTCTDTDGSYTCDNVDECAEGTFECMAGYGCSDTDGSYTCDNIDECAEGTFECMDGYDCADTDGSYTCDNIDECAEGTDHCRESYECSDTDGSFTCTYNHPDELGEQVGTLEIDPVAGTVTVVVQPDSLTLSDAVLSMVTIDEGTFDLTVQNGMGRLVFNLKAVIDSVSSGEVVGSGTLWTDGDKPYVGYGGLSLLAGDSRSAGMWLGGLGTDIVTVELHFIDAPMLLLGSGGYDSVDTSMAQADSYGDHSGGVSPRQRAISPNGRFVYTGGKDAREIDVHDSSTGDYSTIEIESLGDEDGAVAGIAVSADGLNVYALVSFGQHYNGYDADDYLESVTLVELDALTMEETRRMDIHSWVDEATGEVAGDPRSRMARYLAWSPDGTVLAASLGAGNNDGFVTSNELWFIDVETMTAIDTNLETPDVTDPVVLPAKGFGEQMVWDGGYVVVGHNAKNTSVDDDDGAAQLSFVHSGTYEVTTMTPPAGHGPKASAMSSSAGVLYYASRGGAGESVVSAIDIATQAEIYTVFPAADDDLKYAMVEPISGNLFVGDRYESWVFDAATGEPVDADGDPENGITSLGHEWTSAHCVVMTPF